MLTLLSAINDLKVLPRTGWLLAGIRQPESIADHSLATALLALALADDINLDPAAHGLEAPLNVERLLRYALLHDLAESHVTDLPRRATEIVGADAKHDAESRALTMILADYADASRWLKDAHDYAQNDAPESHLVHDVDKLEMTFQAARYVSTGSRGLGDFLVKWPYSFAICAELHERILSALLPDAPA